MARFQSRVLFGVLAAIAPISLGPLSRSEVPELSVVTFCCQVNDETRYDAVTCQLVCQL